MLHVQLPMAQSFKFLGTLDVEQKTENYQENALTLTLLQKS